MKCVYVICDMTCMCAAQTEMYVWCVIWNQSIKSKWTLNLQTATTSGGLQRRTKNPGDMRIYLAFLWALVWCKIYVKQNMKICKIHENMQDIRKYARYMKTCKVYENMQGIWKYARYMKICNVYENMQDICKK